MAEGHLLREPVHDDVVGGQREEGGRAAHAVEVCAEGRHRQVDLEAEQGRAQSAVARGQLGLNQVEGIRYTV